VLLGKPERNRPRGRLRRRWENNNKEERCSVELFSCLVSSLVTQTKHAITDPMLDIS